VFAGKFLDVYALREMSPVERTQYIAEKADAPGLYVPGAQATSGLKGLGICFVQQRRCNSGIVGDACRARSAISKIRSDSSGSKKEHRDRNTALVIHTATKIVGLDVVVTDSKGHLVKGLQRSDFTITEDGKPQELTQLAEYNQTQNPVATASAQPEEKLPPIFFPTVQPAETGAVTVVLFDLLNTPLADQVRAQDELVKFIKNKPKGAQFALCTLGTSLQMFQGFTQDENTLLRR